MGCVGSQDCAGRCNHALRDRSSVALTNWRLIHDPIEPRPDRHRGLVMLIAAVARPNALDADTQTPPGHEIAVVPEDTQRISGPTDGSSANAAVHALFNLHHPETAPFPSDVFTVADRTHNTGRRVNLPYPDCTVHVSDCQDLDVINTLDGFGLQTRISIPFDGPIDANTATKETVFLIRLGSTLRREHDHYGDDDIDNLAGVIGINQVVWDVPTNTLHVESDELLAQHTRYALIVTDGLRDEAGRPIGAPQRSAVSGRRREGNTNTRCSKRFMLRGASACANAIS